MIRNLRMYPTFTHKGTPSVMVKVFTDSGSYSASVPSGTSKGRHEAVELPVSRVLKFFSKTRPHFMGRDEKNWESIDRTLEELDGTKNFSNLGENLALAVSLAAAKAAFRGELWKLENPGLSATFPLPVGNVVGGGIHGGGADWQEFLLIPARARSMYEAVESLLSAWLSIGEGLRDKRLLFGRNIENAWMAKLSDEKTLEMLYDYAKDWGMRLGVDFAASDLWNGRVYKYRKARKELKPGKHLEYIEELAKSYKLYFLEDPLHQDDFKQHTVLTHSLGGKCLIVGDDLYSTNRERLTQGIKLKSTNAIMIKPNQAGTLSRAREVVRLAAKSGMTIVPSHRSGETDDNWLADLAVAWQAPLIKSGVSGLDTPKLNRLLELWEEIPKASMAKLP
jgi:enolase